MTLSPDMFAQLVSLCGGVLLLTAVLIVWRRSVPAAVRGLAVQGIAVAVLAAVIGVFEGEPELIGIAAVVFGLKGLVIPLVLARAAAASPSTRDEAPLINTTAALLWAAVLTMTAYVVAQPVAALAPGPAAGALPVGFALVLIGFLLLMIRRHALGQVTGFLVLDNGIAAIAFLTVGGVPLVVEIGVSLDVLLIVLILYVVTNRMATSGVVDLDDLRELHD
ncbi:MAG: hydrogenase-4 component [Actinomycetota bacterium]|nr:hydrogenase-4 component [Actinomycetota bacterium]